MRATFWIFTLASLLPLPGLADEPLDFSGEWVRATDQANSPADAGSNSNSTANSSDSGSHGGGRGGMGGGSGMGGGGHHGGRHGQNTPGASNDNPNGPADPRLYAHALVIRQSEVVFDVAADGQRMAYRFDNRNNYGAPYGGTVSLTWSTPEMVIETHPDAGGSIEEHYTLSQDGNRLTLRIHEQNAGTDSAREVTHVFVRNTAGAAGTSDQPPLPP
jgi:hypothetical protein